MTAWWSNLSSRERLLISVAGVLAGLLILSFFIVRPIGSWREDADRRADTARSNYELVATPPLLSAARSKTTPLRQTCL